ncbi:MAG TPA: NADH-quinone oxidoreductase subunit N [Terracidiphilus sp.]|nr:NADH-quinone oxidoreductase subunit N [Terracidiphilus sp.]
MNYFDLFRATLPETALEIAVLLVLVVDLGFLRKAALKTRVAIASLLGVAGCGAALWGIGVQTGFGLNVGESLVLAIGGGTAVAQVGILVLTALTLLLLIDSDFTRHVGEYVAVVLMAAAGGLLVASARDLLVIFVGLELLSLGLYILTAFAKSSGMSAEAALKYYLFGGMSAAFLLFGFSYLYGLSGSTDLYWIQYSIGESGASPLLYIAWILIVAGLGFKVAAVPFHLWAPDTYEGAPASAAAFIASVSKVASFALLLTIGGNLLTPGGPISGQAAVVEHYLRNEYLTWQPLAVILLVVAAASMVLGNLAALAQVSVRRLLAYSAIAHAGYILLGIGVHPTYSGQGNPFYFFLSTTGPAFLSTNAVLYYILTYGLTTIGAFGVVSVIERATGSDRLDSFLGLHKRNPLLAAVMLVLFLSLAGIPPLVGFWAKFNLFAAVLSLSAGRVPFALVALAVGMSAVSLYYYLQVLKRAYVMPAADETPIKAHPATLIVLLAIAAAVVVLGCFPALLQGWIASFYPSL